MSETPSLPEATIPVVQRFVIGMDRLAINRATRNLESSALIYFWSTFQSTVDIPFPGAVTGSPVDDIAAVLAGSKPATIVFSDTLREPAVAKFITEEKDRFKSISIGETVDHYGGHLYFFGRKENVNALAQLYQRRGGDDAPLRADEGFHREAGEALGYPIEAIDDFIARISNSKEIAQQK